MRIAWPPVSLPSPQRARTIVAASVERLVLSIGMAVAAFVAEQALNRVLGPRPGSQRKQPHGFSFGFGQGFRRRH